MREGVAGGNAYGKKLLQPGRPTRIRGCARAADTTRLSPLAGNPPVYSGSQHSTWLFKGPARYVADPTTVPEAYDVWVLGGYRRRRAAINADCRINIVKKTFSLILALVVGLAAIVAGLVWDHQRNAALVADSKSRETPYVPATEPDPLVVAVIGDSFTAGSREGGNEERGWASLVEKRLYTHEQPVIVHSHARGGIGYLNAVDGTTFRAKVDELTGSEDVVVIFGSINDRPAPGLAQAVADTIATAREKAPDSTVLVVGPAWTEGRGSSNARLVSEEVRSGAESGLYVDASEWFEGHDDLVGGDRVHPTNEGHAFLADQLAPLIARELGIAA